MSAELDLSQYIDLFLQEADEQLEILEQETIKLETEPTSDRLNIIFRAAHTLKGSSRAMGFATLADVTHEMENLLDELRAGRKEVNTEVADAVLGCLDALTSLITSIREGNGDKGDHAELIATLQRLSSGKGGAKKASKVTKVEVPEDIIAALNQTAEKQNVYHAHFILASDCVMKFARAFMAINQVMDGGELLHTIPSREDIEEEHFETDFHLYFMQAATADAMKTKFGGIGEVDSFTVETWKPGTIATPVAETVVPELTVGETKADEATPIVETTTEQAGKAPVATGGQPPKKSETGQTVRVDVGRLDDLMNLVGELVIDRTRLSQIGASLAGTYQRDTNIDALAETVGHISRITSDLQDQIMKARMLPIETVFNRYPRVVRDLAQKCGKQIHLEITGGETELDRSVIEVIGDPLLHILRNCVDHGVETPDIREKAGKPASGTIKINARHQENYIVIEITDDGKGIDPVAIKAKAIEKGTISKEEAERMTDKEALTLIFGSGVSTAAAITDISGRGVGMDIVRSNIQKLGGLIDLDSTVGQGSRFSLRLPLTLAIIRGLLINVSGVVYVVPLSSVVETLNINKSEIQTVTGSEAVVIRGHTVPLLRLREQFRSRDFTPEVESDTHYVVIVGLADKRLALMVDSLIGEQEVVIKSLSRYCGDVSGLSGATILGNGNVALIMDVNGIFAKRSRQ